ncbi:unnamed protein product [Arctogadus glacialis]
MAASAAGVARFAASSPAARLQRPRLPRPRLPRHRLCCVGSDRVGSGRVGSGCAMDIHSPQSSGLNWLLSVDALRTGEDHAWSDPLDVSLGGRLSGEPTAMSRQDMIASTTCQCSV